MDNTYRPFFRDDLELDVNISMPSLQIKPYRRQFISTNSQSETEDEEENAVTSEIVNETNTTANNVSANTSESTLTENNNLSNRKFTSKEEFKSVMTPIYERLLAQKGLNPAFAKALVAQDGLESGWGRAAQGRFNYGNITLGSNKTRSYTQGRDKDAHGNPITQKFVNYDSLEDYANAKIQLLNSKRYNAFGGSVNEFASRVAKGGYATSPKYFEALSKIIASNKNGGVLKFQAGGTNSNLQKGKEWVINWYRNRTDQLYDNTRHGLPDFLAWLPVSKTDTYNYLRHNMALTRAKVDPSKMKPGIRGYYLPRGRKIYLKEDHLGDSIHEWTHSSRPIAQVKEIEKYKNFFDNNIYDNAAVIPDDYLDDPHEIYARLMSLRQSLNLDPNHKYTKEEINQLKKKLIKNITLTTRLKSENGDTNFFTTKFDKDGNVIWMEPFDPKYKPVPEESIRRVEYKVGEGNEILNRYNDAFLEKLFNYIAQVDRPTQITKAQSGGILERIKNWFNTEPDIVIGSELYNKMKKAYGLGEVDTVSIKKAIPMIQKTNWPDSGLASYIANGVVESGFNPNKQQTNGPGFGIIQSEGSRQQARKNYIGKDNLEKQVQYDIDVMNGTIKSNDEWHHGGKGSGFSSAAAAKQTFLNKNNSSKTIHRALTRGYIRPNANRNPKYEIREQLMKDIYNWYQTIK